jgi:hypothetical protein
VSAHVKSIIALAQAYVAGDIKLDFGINPDTAIKQMVKPPGIGQWTAHYSLSTWHQVTVPFSSTIPLNQKSGQNQLKTSA